MVNPKIVSRKIIPQKPIKLKRTLGLKDFYEKRNKILITRAVGGLGDILMHRMIFEDIKRIIPDCELHFACPKIYHDAVKDHPFIDRLLASDKFEPKDYIAHYNTTTACGQVELHYAPNVAPNRCDIWSNHCGYQCQNYDMHITFTDEEKQQAKDIINGKRDRTGPVFLLSPISAMNVKNLLPHQIMAIVQEIQKLNSCVIGLHNNPIIVLEENNIPTINTSGKLRLWMALINEADYVVSVDTSAFHCAGGLKKPVLGFFTFVNGDMYSKYYPTSEIVQGPCPLNYAGCYNCAICPTRVGPKPCITNVTVPIINDGIHRLLQRFPSKLTK